MKRLPKKWLIFSSLFIQIAVIINLMIWVGKYLDFKFSSDNLFTLIFSSTGIILIILLIIIQTKRLDDN
ncbi:MAG: AtpZ/AtpI family protein [Flavobacteriaceae bacterium]